MKKFYTKNVTFRKSVFTLFILAIFTSPVCAGNPSSKAKKSTVELEALRDQIQQIKSEIDQRRGQSDELRKQLEKSETEVEKAITEAKALDEKIRKKNEALDKLKQQQEEKVEALNQHKEFLIEQIRVAYMNQNHSMVKMVLNKDDPAKASRNMIYHQYFSKARSEKIANVGQQISEIQNIQKVVSFETEQLQILRVFQQENLQAVEQKKKERQLIIANLDKELLNKNVNLKRMQQDAGNLGELVTSLNKAVKQARIAKLEKAKRDRLFVSLKGKLNWPSDGRIIHRYGTSRNESSLNWKGMLINSPFGSDVRTISRGQIIFSGWFQNLGKLIIVDHGQDYMSLYGHNSELFKSVGDKVKTGEVIASVGDSGGRKNSGLYFEIRQKGVAVNPAIWCKGQFKQASS